MRSWLHVRQKKEIYVHVWKKRGLGYHFSSSREEELHTYIRGAQTILVTYFNHNIFVNPVILISMVAGYNSAQYVGHSFRIGAATRQPNG